MNVLDQITAEYKKSDIPAFNVGDTVKVHIKIKEGTRERIQIFEGFVLKRQHGGVRETFTVRRLASGVGVEKTFPLHSPKIDKIEVVKTGKVRRAKLHYMRERTGKSAKIKARILTQEQIEAEAAAIAAAEAEAQESARVAEEAEAAAKAKVEAEKAAKAAEEAKAEADAAEEVAEEPAEATEETVGSAEEKTEE
jgi:large subunit ribosomal protein L19